MITIISLGVNEGDVSLRAIQAMKEADRVLLRTASQPSARVLADEGIAFESLDYLYEKSRNYDTLCKNIVKEVIRQGANCKLCYCVDGGVCEDRAASVLRQKQEVKMIEGVSKSSSAAARAGIFGSYCACSAYELQNKKLSLPLVVYEIDNSLLAGDLKLILGEQFGDETQVIFLNGDKEKRIALYELDMQKEYGSQTSLVIEEIPLLKKKKFDFEDAVAVLRRLRAPDGCPWDRVQTHESIRINAIEEAYELVDAIDSKDVDKLCEEAGDVLMQALFHALIAEEEGDFTVVDMLTGLCEKLITRHTHVFGDDSATGAVGALSVWEKNKMTEKGQNTFSDSVNDVPECFPALLRAQKVAKRVEKGGFPTPSLEKLAKNLAVDAQDLQNCEDKYGALGELLMTAVQMGRVAGADCEQALLDKAKSLQALYTAYEGFVLRDGKDVRALTEEEKESYRQRAREYVARN